MSATPAIYDLLVKAGCIKFGQFRLKSGAMSPVYIDLRELMRYPEDMTTIARALIAATDPATYDAVCGAPYAAIPYAMLVGQLANKQLVILRKAAKKHGPSETSGDVFPGVTPAARRVLVIEDVCTTGGSIMETADALTAAGYEVTGAICIVDRGATPTTPSLVRLDPQRLSPMLSKL